MAAGGVVLGLAGAAALTRVMTTLLFGVTARDPLTFGAGDRAARRMKGKGGIYGDDTFESHRSVS